MFQIISDFTNRQIIGEMSIDQFVSTMKNPDFMHKSKVDTARKFSKDDFKYKKLKSSLPCIIFNFKHSGEEVNSSTIKSSTGYLYLDFDGCSKFDFSKFEFISAAWHSLSGTGLGVLVKCNNLDKDNLKNAVLEVSKELNLSPDLKAVSKDRCNVIGYDENIYYNPESISFTVHTEGFIEKVSNSSISINLNRWSVNDTFYEKKIRFSNYQDLVKSIDFNGELFVDLGKNKLKYSEVIIPKVVKPGSRNQTMFTILSQVYSLNIWVTEKTLLSLGLSINSNVFHPKLPESEVTVMAKNIIKAGPKPAALNKARRIIFNSDYDLSGGDRRSIAAKYLNKKRSKDTSDKILEYILQNKNSGLKLTYERISENTGISLSTVKRRKDVIKEFLQNLTQ